MENNLSKSNLSIKFTLKLWKDRQASKTYSPRTIRRFWSKVKANNWHKAYVKVTYGKAITNSGKLETIFNDGTYFSLPDIRQAVLAFTEQALLKDTYEWINKLS